MQKESCGRRDVHAGGWQVFGHQSNHGRSHRGNRNGVRFTRTVRRKTARATWERSHLEMIVVVPWRTNEDDATMKGERLKEEVVVMDTNFNEKLEIEEHVPVPKRVYMPREDLEVFRFTARSAECLSLLKETVRQTHTENCRKRFEEELRSTIQADAAQRRVKEYQDKAAARRTKRTNTNLENQQQRRTQAVLFRRK